MSGQQVLICDDEELIRWSLCEHLEQVGYRTHAVENGEECVAAVKDLSPSLVLLDLKMPRMDGLTALRLIREGGSDVPVIMITAHGDVDSAIRATHLGAVAYLSKPFDLREIALAVEKALTADRLKHEVHYLRNRRRKGYGDFIGVSSALDDVFKMLRQLEKVDAPTILITGESGTGKDVIARAIHASGPRKNEVFVEIDCASLPEQLIESELFGHERGAFTDARNAKRGLFEVAAGGVVFLDEIGEMSMATQAKLLRTLENRRFKRVGGVATLNMTASVVAATNRDLRKEVQEGRFREDLFFRLNIIPLELPPLRQRRDDIPALVEHFLNTFSKRFARPLKGVSGPAMEMLQAHDWPGNVRELRNVLERIVILGPEEIIGTSDLPAEVRYASSGGATMPGCPFTLPEAGVSLDGVERGLIAQALARTGDNQSAAARMLGISRYALRYRVEKFELMARRGRGPTSE